MHSSPYILTSSGDPRYFGRNQAAHYYRHDLEGPSRGAVDYSASDLAWKRMPTPVSFDPHENDVLLGRGGRNNQHSGNNMLRQFARAEGDNYRVASKKGKSALSRLLVRQMRELDPPARFLKRVQQTAAWEEVSEDTAREKASQVLRDAVAGLFEGNEEDEEQEVSSHSQPLRTISAPVSMDEFDRTIHPPISRSRPADFQPPRSNRSDSSEAKRRRYAVEAATFHSFDDHYPSRQQPIVGYSPIRRHSDNSYAAGSYSDPTSRRSTSQSNLPQITAAESRTHHRRQSSGNLDEFDLLHGELLDSDVEDEATVPSETKSGAL